MRIERPPKRAETPHVPEQLLLAEHALGILRELDTRPSAGRARPLSSLFHKRREGWRPKANPKREGGRMHRMLVAGVAAITGSLVLAAPALSAPSCPKPSALPEAFVSQIDNPYLPLKPGTTLTYRGKLDGKSATDVVSVTNRTKVILGVTTTVVHDQVFIKGELVEDTEDWFAQDTEGNVWYLGEDTKELENGQVVSTEGSWEAGVDNARAGIFMPAEPKVGQVFKQEDAKNVAEDCSRIVDLHASVRTRFVSSNEALKTEEFSLLEPDVLDNKFYVRDTGLVREQTVEGGSDFLELVSVTGPLTAASR
jgi:hypothetical protein